MSRYLLVFCHCMIVTVAASFCLSAVADEESSGESSTKQSQPQTLTIGSQAPSLDIEHWYSFGEYGFDKVTEFVDDKIYVIEFWATWCGPCISSMPHLAETQERHAQDGVQVVSISDEDEKTVQRFLKRELRQQALPEDDHRDGDDPVEAKKSTYADLTSAYCLTSDPDRSAHDAYMKAAAQNGIPTAFIVGKSGLIEWIGHPMSMDKPLQAVVDDEWDRDAFSKEFQEKQAFTLVLQKVRRLVRSHDYEEALALLGEAKEAATGRNKQLADAYIARYYSQRLQYMASHGETDEALKLVEADIEQSSDAKRSQLRKLRVELLLSSGRTEDATEALADLIPDLGSFELNEIAWAVYEQVRSDNDEMDPKLLETAIKAAEMAVEQSPKQSPILDTLAHLVYLQGDLSRALEIQTEAVETAKRVRPSVEAFLKKLKKEIADGRED